MNQYSKYAIDVYDQLTNLQNDSSKYFVEFHNHFKNHFDELEQHHYNSDFIDFLLCERNDTLFEYFNSVLLKLQLILDKYFIQIRSLYEEYPDENQFIISKNIYDVLLMLYETKEDDIYTTAYSYSGKSLDNIKHLNRNNILKNFNIYCDNNELLIIYDNTCIYTKESIIKLINEINYKINLTFKRIETISRMTDYIHQSYDCTNTCFELLWYTVQCIEESICIK